MATNIMHKEIHRTIERLIHIPYDFHHKNKSLRTLLQETGYFDMYKNITQNEINILLKLHPHLIRGWLQWSDDKRTTTGWFFTKSIDGIYFVAHYPEGKEFEQITSTDEFFACAAFIKHESESIRVLFKK